MNGLLDSHITPVRKTLIGWLLNTVLYSRLPYWCTSSYIVVIQNTLYLSFNLDIVFITLEKARLMVCSLMPHTLPLQYISLLCILASALLIMLQTFGIICLMMYVSPLLSTHSEEAQNLSLCTSIFTLFYCIKTYLHNPNKCLRTYRSVKDTDNVSRHHVFFY